MPIRGQEIRVEAGPDSVQGTDPDRFNRTQEKAACIFARLNTSSEYIHHQKFSRDVLECPTFPDLSV